MVSLKSEYPDLFPSPKSLTLLEGMSDLSVDVRLVTNNVAPLQRKAIRTVLCDVGLRVVANKKKYLVEVEVRDPDTFDMHDVPEANQEEYYELRIDGSEIKISAPAQPGTVFASYTLGNLLRRFMSGQQLPNMFIRDWPYCVNRGVYIDCSWGMDKMNLSDWHRAIDFMATLKLNVLGIGMYNCTGTARFEGNNKPGDFLMTAFEGEDRVRVDHAMDWYSADQDFWNRDAYQVNMISVDNLMVDVFNYAAEKAMRVIPLFNSLGHNTLLPRSNKEISARNADGKPTGVGYCLSSPVTRAFLEKNYGDFVSRRFPNGLDYFDIGLDEVLADISAISASNTLHDGWCHCAECSKKSKGELVTEYVIWMVKMLIMKNVHQVVIHHGVLADELKVFDTLFVKRLEEEGLKRLVVVLWQEDSNALIQDVNRVSNGVKQEIESWASPLQSKETWNGYQNHLDNVDHVICTGFKDGANGVMMRSLFDPMHWDHQVLLSAYCWESPEGETANSVCQRWCSTRFGEKASLYEEAMEKLREVGENRIYGLCLSYQYMCIQADKPWPRVYPGEALDALEAEEETQDALTAANMRAKEAKALLDELMAGELSEQDKFMVSSQLSECSRVQAYVCAFKYLLELRAKLSEGMVLKSMVASTIKARDEYLEHMTLVEQGKPYHCIPSVMHSMSLLFAFFNQLIYDLKKYTGRKQAKLIPWGVTGEKR